jgi:L-alanine-DL-glutamate epimerase-like enolase superfamily enzyme
MAKVTRSTRTPICTGENFYSSFPVLELLKQQAADIIETDFPRCGGLSGMRRIAELADLYYVPLATHNVCSPIATIAAGHVCASIPNFLVLEYHAQDVPWWADLVSTPKTIMQDGYLLIPDAPGIGVELNDDLARQHLKTGENYFED